jgi:tetratricopeptide (TPR) repeat protein
MMNILARILSHGFAIAVVVILAVVFIYRGELFPGMKLPAFLYPGTPAETESEIAAADVEREEPAVEIAAVEAPAEAAPEAPAEEAPVEEPPAEAAAVEMPEEAAPEAPAEEAPVEEPPVEAAPETPAEEAPVEEPPVEAAAVEMPEEAAPEAPPTEAPVEEPPVEAAAVEMPEEAAPEAPPTEAPVEEPAEEAAAVEMPEEAAPEAPAEEAPAEEPAVEIAAVVPQEAEASIRPRKTANPYRLLAAAREAFWKRDYARAETSYRELIALEPDNPDGYGELGNMYFAQGKWEQAAEAYYDAGTRLVVQNRIQQAEVLVQVIRGLNGDQADALAEQIAAARTANTGTSD